MSYFTPLFDELSCSLSNSFWLTVAQFYGLAGNILSLYISSALQAVSLTDFYQLNCLVVSLCNVVVMSTISLYM